MSTWDIQDHYYSGQGVVMLAAKDPTTGNPLGFVPVGNVSDLRVSITTNTVEHRESHTGQRGIDLRLITETNAAVSMTLENFSSENLARVARGTDTDITGASVTDDPVEGYLGKVTALRHIKISSFVLKKVATTLTAYVNDTTDWDYKVNLEAGSFMINPDTGTQVNVLADGDDLLASYTFATQARVDGLTQGQQEFYARFEGLNTADANNPVIVELFKIAVDPFRELALISDDVQQYVLEGSLLADSTRTTGSKYFRELLLR